MNKRNLIIAAAMIVLLSLNFAVKNYLIRRDTIKVVEAVLSHWKNNDLTLAMPYWKNEIDSPPVYSLLSYTIEKGTVNKVNGQYTAQIPVILDFPINNIFPSGKRWIFKMDKTRLGWKIIDFQRVAQSSKP